MGCCRCLHNFFRKFDLFPASQFLRYRGDPEYTTATGGIISLGVLTIFIILFATMGIQTAKRQIIEASETEDRSFSPGQIIVNASPAGGFMFGIYLFGLNLNDPNITYFDIQMQQFHMESVLGAFNATDVPLVPCTAQHFAFNDEIQKRYWKFNGPHWLCPPLGHNFNLSGNAGSDLYSMFKVTIRKCNPNTTSNCASDSQIEAIQRSMNRFAINLPVINYAINAHEQEYNQIYFEDRNMYFFSTDLGLMSTAYIEEVVVNTDMSLLPTQDIVRETFISVPEIFQTTSVSVANETYAEITYMRSPVDRTYERSFNKIDNYFSYVGGLIGTILGMIFVMSVFAEKAYSLSIASHLFQDEEGKSLDSSGFHVGLLFASWIKIVTDALGCCKNSWKKTQKYEECIDEMDQQLDIGLILKKLLFLQKAVGTILGKHQFEALHLGAKPSLEDAVQNRKRYQMSSQVRLKEKEGNRYEDEANSVNSSPQSIQPPRNCSRDSSGQAPHNGSKEDGKGSSEENGDYGVAYEELSAVSVRSLEGGQRKQIKKSLNRLIGESKRGQKISMRILNQVDPEILLKLGLGSEIPLMEESERSSEVGLRFKSSSSSFPQIKLCPSYDDKMQ